MSGKVYAKFTIEAVLVMPIVLFTIVFVIYLSFYLYDYCRIQAITDLLLHRAALNLKHEADIAEGDIFYDEIGRQGVFYQAFGISESKLNHMESFLADKLSKGLLATEVTDINVSANMLKVSVCVEGKFLIPIKGVAEMLFKERTVKVEAERELHNPANTVRMSEVVLDLGSKIKDLSEIKENLESLRRLP